MALLEEWVLSEPVNEALRSKVEKALLAVLPKGLGGSARLEGSFLFADVNVPSDDIETVGSALAEPIGCFRGWDWRDDIDAIDEGEAYHLRVEIVEKQPDTFKSRDGATLTILSAYSKDADNLAGWPVAFALAARLSRELGGEEPDEEPSPEVLS